GPGGTTTTSTPTITWTAPTGATQYELRIDNLTTGLVGMVQQPGLLTNSYTGFTFSDGTYRAQVRARNSAGELGEWSVPLDFNIRTAIPTAAISPITPDP